MWIASLAAIAIVTQDPAPLRASPRDSAPQQAQLWQGDALEIRGERLDYLQVYDHRRERAGYVLASQVRTTSATAAEAPELLSVLRFVRDTPGAESLGIAYAAAYLKAVPASALTAEPLDALGTLADRLAARASGRAGSAVAAGAAESRLPAHLEGVAQYGVKMLSLEQDGVVQVCYDGEAFRQVLAMPSATPEHRARAALVLARADSPQLPPTLKNRLRLREAGVWAALAHAQSRRAEVSAADVLTAGQKAVQALAAVVPAELTDGDQADYTQAALRVGASRWAAQPAVAPAGRLAVRTEPGEPGQTCVLLVDPATPARAPMLRRCTYGTVWAASAQPRADGQALALAVQPLAAWRELWIFQRDAASEGGWRLDVLPPAPSANGIGYAEFAGWVPGDGRLLVVREARVEGRTVRSFEVIRTDTLATEKQASRPDLLVLFTRWQAPGWKRGRVSLR